MIRTSYLVNHEVLPVSYCWRETISSRTSKDLTVNNAGPAGTISDVTTGTPLSAEGASCRGWERSPA